MYTKYIALTLLIFGTMVVFVGGRGHYTHSDSDLVADEADKKIVAYFREHARREKRAVAAAFDEHLREARELKTAFEERKAAAAAFDEHLREARAVKAAFQERLKKAGEIQSARKEVHREKREEIPAPRNEYLPGSPHKQWLQ